VLRVVAIGLLEATGFESTTARRRWRLR
jgi:hypothetical protein